MNSDLLVCKHITSKSLLILFSIVLVYSAYFETHHSKVLGNLFAGLITQISNYTDMEFRIANSFMETVVLIPVL